MALQFGPNTRSLFSGLLLKILGNRVPSATAGTGPDTLGMTIYKGTAPPAATVAGNWAAYNSSSADYLVHFTNAQWSQPSGGPLLSVTTLPTAVAPTQSGTATWAIIWTLNPTPAELAGTTLPKANFLVVSVSDPNGDGVLRFTSPILTSGTPVTILDGSMASFI